MKKKKDKHLDLERLFCLDRDGAGLLLRFPGRGGEGGGLCITAAWALDASAYLRGKLPRRLRVYWYGEVINKGRKVEVYTAWMEGFLLEV
eukprot:1334563-Amorphochlora_amoeboformis.AAC.1